jgi:muramoyltetrapeptide carboxypeptidase
MKILKRISWILNPFKVIVVLCVLFSQDVFAANIQVVTKMLNNTKIHVVAPASGVADEDLSRVKNSGLNLDLRSECFNSNNPFHSADDETRFQCLKNAIYDEKVEVIWCLRGGYGSAKLIEKLAELPKPNKQKIFIGYSDITALHIFFNQEWGWKTIHGPSLIELVLDKKDISSMLKLARIITHKVKETTVENIIPLNKIAKNTSKIDASLTGGNLTMVTTSLGTKWFIKAEGKILFLEDVGAKPYQIDRLLNHLKQAKVFEGVKAIIFGSFDQDDKSTMEVLKIFAEEIKIPVFKTDRLGHQKFNDPIICNSPSFIAPSAKNGYFNLVMNW